MTKSRHPVRLLWGEFKPLALAYRRLELAYHRDLPEVSIILHGYSGYKGFILHRLNSLM